ncbi:MAG: hypothetical protein HOI41_07745, partial [Acidimicrobiaceae bacterium]|nr:hypothetical protein [Acidimicrobiaceae bacterium]
QAIASMPDKEPRILHRRINEHRSNMQAVIDGVAAAVHRESDGPNPIFG